MVRLQQGSVVRVEIPDQSGRNLKPHPIVILSRTDDMAIQKELIGVVASHTAAKRPVWQDSYVELPHANSGNCRSGFTKRTVAVCDWVRRINKVEIADEQIIGYLAPQYLEPVIDKVNEIIQRQSRQNETGG